MTFCSFIENCFDFCCFNVVQLGYLCLSCWFPQPWIVCKVNDWHDNAVSDVISDELDVESKYVMHRIISLRKQKSDAFYQNKIKWFHFNSLAYSCHPLFRTSLFGQMSPPFQFYNLVITIVNLITQLSLILGTRESLNATDKLVRNPQRSP